MVFINIGVYAIGDTIIQSIFKNVCCLLEPGIFYEALLGVIQLMVALKKIVGVRISRQYLIDAVVHFGALFLKKTNFSYRNVAQKNNIFFGDKLNWTWHFNGIENDVGAKYKVYCGDYPQSHYNENCYWCNKQFKLDWCATPELATLWERCDNGKNHLGWLQCVNYFSKKCNYELMTLMHLI